MSIQLLTNDHYERLLDIFDRLEKEILIISPFITMPLTSQLCAIIKQNANIHCEIITRYYREDFIKGVSNIRALKKLHSCGAKIYVLKGLHTKLYLADGKIAIIGSANFTSGGFKLNHELSILIEDESSIIQDIQLYYSNLLTAIKNEGDFTLTAEKIDAEITMVEKIRKNRNPSDVNIYQYGADVKIDVNNDNNNNEDKIDTVQTIFSNANAKTIIEGIWLKFEGTAEKRENPHERYYLITTDKYPNGITCFPSNKRPTGIRKGAYIYLAVVSTDKHGNNVPVIVGRARTYGYEEENKADNELEIIFPWMKSYPFFIRLYNVEYLDTEQQNGISLLDLLANVGPDTYPSSVGTSKSIFELQKIHYQKSHLKLTEKAKAYLDDRFEQLAKEYIIVKK